MTKYQQNYKEIKIRINIERMKAIAETIMCTMMGVVIAVVFYCSVEF